ncbi:chemotaxis protein CheC [Halorussus marinus]|uniref:chemotaxis protein CheC n=1 Tax=Halorussus marinus TaxID=2505976 RepID=UPI00106E9444|nr:chemotaxis protein CheC [Halorussus marinus]
MKVDIEALGSFSRTAHDGAERAAENLTGLTGIETTADVTAVTLAREDSLVREDRDRIGVVVDFDGEISGTTVLSFPPQGVETVLGALLPGDGLDESAVQEVGNIVTSGFVDAWADRLSTTLDITPPTYVEGTDADILEAASFESDRAFVFRSRLSAVGEALDFEFYMFPDNDSMTRMLSDGSGDGAVPLAKLSTLQEMAQSGAATAADSVSAMTGIDTAVDISELRFAPIESIPAELSDRRHVGVVLGFGEGPDGYVLILFDESSARAVVDALAPDAAATDSFDEMAESAIREIGNVMTSSFVDGWANVLDTTIAISTPQFVDDMGRAVADSVVARLGQRQAFAFLFDATIRADDRAFDCEIYAIPEETQLEATLDDIDPDATAERSTKAGSL